VYKFLVVDDEPSVLELIADLVEEIFNQCEVDTAVDGQDGLEKANKKSYDVILTDFKMPNMDGAEFIRAVRDGSGPNKDTGFLIITGFMDLATIEISTLKNTLILNKPVTMSQLESNVKISFSARLL
jgi:YesN/AraC family two-component response regulator